MNGRNGGNRSYAAVLRGIHGIHRNMVAWSMADKAILYLSTAALCVAIAEWIMDPPHTGVGTLLAAMLCLMLALMSWKAHMAAWCIIFVAAIGDLLVGVDPAGPSTTWAMLLAMVSLGRTARAWECALSLVITLSTVTYAAIRYPDIMGYGIPGGIANLGVGLLCAYLVGVSINYRQIQRAQKEALHRIEQTQRNQLMASLFHEAISGNLTRIIVSAECLQRENPDAYERCGMADIVHYADDALRQTHQAIDMLQRDGMTPDAAKRITVQAAVTSVMASGDRRLHDLEYQGCSDVQGECSQYVGQRSLVFLALLRRHIRILNATAIPTVQHIRFTSGLPMTWRHCPRPMERPKPRIGSPHPNQEKVSRCSANRFDGTEARSTCLQMMDNGISPVRCR